MRTALMLVCGWLADFFSDQAAAKVVLESAVAMALFKLYGLLVMVQNGRIKPESLDWEGHLEDIPDRALRDQLHALLVNDEALAPVLGGGPKSSGSRRQVRRGRRNGAEAYDGRVAP